MITASAARRTLTRKARTESIRSQVRAELDRAARDERAAAQPVEAPEVEIPRPARPCQRALDASLLVWLVLVMAAVLSAALRPTGGRLNRHGRRTTRARLGCYAPYTADGGPPAHDPAACDASCHAGTTEIPQPKIPYGGRRSRRWRDGPSLRLSQRIWRLTEGRQCGCATCAARAEIEAGRELVPGEVRHTPETWALHQADTLRELALWQAVVWGPEAAAELARLRPDDRPTDSAWARLRLALEALGVLWAHAHGPPGVGGVIVFCHSADLAPPELAAARRSQPRIAAHCMGAPVT